MESQQIRSSVWKRLKAQYESLNVAGLYREIEVLRNRRFDLMEAQGKAKPAKSARRGPGIRVRSLATSLWVRQVKAKTP